METSYGNGGFSHLEKKNEVCMDHASQDHTTNDDEKRIKFQFVSSDDDEEHQRSNSRLVRQDSGINQAFAHINILQADISDFHPHETLIHEDINPFAVQYIDTALSNEAPQVEVQSTNEDIGIINEIEIVVRCELKSYILRNKALILFSKKFPPFFDSQKM